MGKTQDNATGTKPSIRCHRDGLSLDELIAQQGARPIHDLDALGRLWPEDDDPDAFRAFIESERAARRAIVKPPELD